MSIPLAWNRLNQYLSFCSRSSIDIALARFESWFAATFSKRMLLTGTSTRLKSLNESLGSSQLEEGTLEERTSS